jgi:hypothetical protein
MRDNESLRAESSELKQELDILRMAREQLIQKINEVTCKLNEMGNAFEALEDEKNERIRQLHKE